jgi:hypothetical protein
MRRLWILPLGLSLLVLALAAPSAAASSQQRPMKGSCSTTFTIGFDPATGLPLAHILGSCQFTHLGATRYEAWQWLHDDGSVVNNGTYTAANGDQLFTRATGTGLPTGPGPALALQFSEWYTRGTGRFAHVVTLSPTGPPSVTGAGTIDLVTMTGWFASAGSIGY